MHADRLVVNLEPKVSLPFIRDQVLQHTVDFKTSQLDSEPFPAADCFPVYLCHCHCISAKWKSAGWPENSKPLL